MCADPAIAIARSKATWPRIAVAIVRRKNLRILKIVRFLGFDAARLSDDRLVLESVETLAKSPVWGMVTALDFLRLIGHAGSLSSVVGGGGRGDELISPIRRSVKVSWAFVGTPFRSVLCHDSVRGVALQMMG